VWLSTAEADTARPLRLRQHRRPASRPTPEGDAADSARPIHRDPRAQRGSARHFPVGRVAAAEGERQRVVICWVTDGDVAFASADRQRRPRGPRISLFSCARGCPHTTMRRSRLRSRLA
jgi:hypothetical protein